MSRPRPHKDPSSPVIPLDIVDAPTQRLYLAAAVVLVQAYKLSTFLAGPSGTLWQWILIDAVTLECVHRLRVPRLTWGFTPRATVALALVALDYLLFGTWTFTASAFLPASIKALVTHYYSTAERSVRLSNVVGTDHLGGQYTVHILAVSTAILNPLSSTYCRFPTTPTTTGEPTLIPLVLNNTHPSKLTYSLTSLTDPASTREITVPASDLVKPRKHHLLHHHHHQQHLNRHEDDDDFALAAQWSLEPRTLKPSSSSDSKKKNLHHPLVGAPALSAAAASSASSPSRASIGGEVHDPGANGDPFARLSSTESLYYLAVTTPGYVQLVSILDTDGHPIRIRRKRTAGTAYERTLVTDCPQAGFDLAGDKAVEHRCVVDPGSFAATADESGVSLGLSVQGNAPLKVTWSSSRPGLGGAARKQDALEGIVGPDADGQVDEARAAIRVPLNVSLSTAGRTDYSIERVVDVYGNEVVYPRGGGSSAPPLVAGTVASRSVVVHRLPEAMFAGECAKGDEVQLLHGRKKKVEIRVGGLDDDDDGSRRARVGLRFTPLSSDGRPGAAGWTREIEAKGRNVEVQVEQQGRYEIVQVESDYCRGAVLVPNACTLILQPLPTLATTFTTINDLCSAPTGLLTTLHLTGVAPFTVAYSLTRVASPSRPALTTHHTHRLTHSRDELRLEPGPGEWHVRFTHVEDRYYKKLPLQGDAYAHRIKVDQVASARWRDAHKTVHSCEGATVGVELDLEGSAPWTVEYAVVGQNKPQVIEGIQHSPHHLEVDIPPLVSQQGGQFALSLESVLDAQGCRRPLTSPDLVVDVRRTKPTARFHGAQGKRHVVIREGDEARVPVRLTGEGPWTITYSAPTSKRPVSFRAHHANVDLLIPAAPAGTYELLSVRDKFCPGDVVETEWTVGILERPKVGLDPHSGDPKRKGGKGVLERRGVCQNEVDRVDVWFEGKAPFTATYTLAKGDSAGARTHSLQAIQPRAALTLFTAEPGRHAYELVGVSDSLYPAETSSSSSSGRGVVAPFRLEQDVWALPSAHFAPRDAGNANANDGFCVDDELASDDLVVELAGHAPFEVELEVRSEGSRGNARKYTVPAIHAHRWAVALPYKLRTATRHSIAVRRVVDAHGCEVRYDPAPSSSSSSSSQSQSGPTLDKKKKNRTFSTVAVSEPASIVPVSTQVDHCVGDLLEFDVRGGGSGGGGNGNGGGGPSSPFTVKYAFEDREHTVALAKGTNRFSRVATDPGTFRVVSVGRGGGGEDQCRSNRVDLVKRIHAIPSARVSTGESIVVDLREGDQTEIVFSFSGTAPFAFTYSRRAPQDRSNDKKVLETHTVTGIEENSYSILTSQEGTYSVSYIADKYCSYPPASSSSSAASKSGAVVRS
ncbi:hypothetical protein JCM11491_003547 [Sporobolomyces phaffii]